MSNDEQEKKAAKLQRECIHAKMQRIGKRSSKKTDHNKNKRAKKKKKNPPPGKQKNN
ncbi:hypothetical protein LXA52_17925 [Erwinia amylovora]|uniref:hypothetical protein n=1 Tax=Erwinia amylovora TaxID=552 RepID=UPI0020BE2AF2|nr:hypothetical protein [Erwinia amylovora]MCK8346435.1 hypothetical protein [Erwinia amylovora]